MTNNKQLDAPEGAEKAFDAFFNRNLNRWEDIGLDQVFYGGFEAGQSQQEQGTPAASWQ